VEIMAKKMFPKEIFLRQVKKLMEENGIKDQKVFNDMVGVQRAISRWKSGESRPSVDSLMVIQEIFGKSVDWLLTGEEPRAFHPAQPIIALAGTEPEVPDGLRPEYYLAVPLVEARIAAGHAGAIPRDYVEDLVWIYKPEIGVRQHHNLRAVRLRTDAESMEPTIRRGSIVIIDPTEIQITPKAIFAVRMDSEGGCALKRVQQTKDLWVLVSDNPEYDPIAIEKANIPNIIIGRVIWSWTSWVWELLYEGPGGSNAKKNGLL
jgi:phage repressor protein C with HTH and peptisase S24 domain